MKHGEISDVSWYGESRPARGAWIETSDCAADGDDIDVAPRTGRVD